MDKHVGEALINASYVLHAAGKLGTCAEVTVELQVNVRLRAGRVRLIKRDAMLCFAAASRQLARESNGIIRTASVVNTPDLD